MDQIKIIGWPSSKLFFNNLFSDFDLYSFNFLWLIKSPFLRTEWKNRNFHWFKMFKPFIMSLREIPKRFLIILYKKYSILVWLVNKIHIYIINILITRSRSNWMTIVWLISRRPSFLKTKISVFLRLICISVFLQKRSIKFICSCRLISVTVQLVVSSAYKIKYIRNILCDKYTVMRFIILTFINILCTG